MRNKMQLLLEMCTNVADNHICEKQEHMECELGEKIKIILMLNKCFRKNIGDPDLEVVNQFLDEDIENAILLLAGDERKEAKKLLIECMTDSKKRKIFYDTSHYKCWIPVGPFFILFANCVDELLNLATDDEDGKFYLANSLFSDRLFLHYGEIIPDSENDLVSKVEKIIREACGRSLFSDPALIFDIYSAMLIEGIGGWNIDSFSTDDLISRSSSKEFPDDVIIRLSTKKEDFCNLPEFMSNDTCYILHDPENWKKKYSELPEMNKRGRML